MRRAFTLIELLLVVAVIAILSGLIATAATFAIEHARSVSCKSQLRQIWITSLGNDPYVPVGQLSNALPIRIFKCRSDRSTNRLSYIWRDGQMQREPISGVIGHDRQPFHHKRYNALLAGGEICQLRIR